MSAQVAINELPEKPLPKTMTNDEAFETLRRLAFEKQREAKRVVELGYADEPPANLMRDAEVLDALGLIFEALLPNWDDHRTLIRKKRFAQRDGR